MVLLLLFSLVLGASAIWCFSSARNHLGLCLLVGIVAIALFVTAVMNINW